MQVNHWNGTSWNYPGNGAIGNSYEGWLYNGFTEFSIPWVNLGNPEGIAVSVHISDEDSQNVPEIFPGLNTTGNHPEIEYFYAFYEPFISGLMPLSGMEPASVHVVPNTEPQITNFFPVEPTQTIVVTSSVEFIVNAVDLENDAIDYMWKLDGSPVSTISNFSYNPTISDLGIHTLRAIISDHVPGNLPDTVEWTVEVIEEALTLNLKVFLEGPFGGTDMNTQLNDKDVIPFNQPYNFSPWNYSGAEEVLVIPGIDITDWILVEIRDATDVTVATDTTTIAQQAAFIKKDGTVIGIDGSNNLLFHVSLTNNLFVVIHHRNHLDILSAFPLIETNGIFYYDFTDGEAKAYGGFSAHKEIAAGIWGMISGDANADGTIDLQDYIGNWFEEAGSTGYNSSDFNMDSEVGNEDKNDFWLPNYLSGSGLPQ
jgi:hypothetical protein